MSYQAIKLARVDRVAIITLNRPEVLNALSRQLISELDQAITHLEQNDGVEAIIITGAGDKAFSAGADIHENRQLSPEGRDELQAARANYNWHLATCAKPVIGAINGLCYGGGTVLATAMDFLVGCERTCFRFLAVNYGQMNATWSLPMLVGWARAKELLYTGRDVGAEEAYRIGLINHLFPSGQLIEKTMEFASAIARNPPGSVANIKQMLMEHTGRSLSENFWGEAEARTSRMKGLPIEEGFKDFLSRKGRPPGKS